jgi:hypothetical protein
VMTMLMGNLTTTLVLNRQTFFFLVNENGKSFALFRKKYHAFNEKGSTPT